MRSMSSMPSICGIDRSLRMTLKRLVSRYPRAENASAPPAPSRRTPSRPVANQTSIGLSAHSARPRSAIEHAGVLLGVSLVLFICSVQLGAGMAQRLVRPAAVVTVGLVAFAVALALLPYVPPLPTLLVIGILAGLPAASLVGAPAEILRSETRAP